MRHHAPARGRAWRRALTAAVVLVGLAGCLGRDGPRQPAVSARASTVVAGPRGEVERVPLADSSFGASGDYWIYLPAGYGQDPRRRYPVVYLLHGGSDPVSFFVQLGIRQAMDGAVASGAVGPMLLVLVDGGPMFTGDGSTTRTFDDYLAT